MIQRTEEAQRGGNAPHPGRDHTWNGKRGSGVLRDDGKREKRKRSKREKRGSRGEVEREKQMLAWRSGRGATATWSVQQSQKRE